MRVNARAAIGRVFYPAAGAALLTHCDCAPAGGDALQAVSIHGEYPVGLTVSATRT